MNNNFIIKTQIDMLGSQLQRFNEAFMELYHNPDLINNDYDAQQLPEILNNVEFTADQLETITQKLIFNE